MKDRRIRDVRLGRHASLSNDLIARQLETIEIPFKIADLNTRSGISNFKYQENSRANKSKFNAWKFYDLFEERGGCLESVIL